MTELFRREAVRHATRRLEGEVLLVTPLSIKTLGLFLAAVIFAALAFLTRIRPRLAFAIRPSYAAFTNLHKAVERSAAG